MAIKIRLQKVVTFFPDLARLLGGNNHAIYLQQLIYWSDKGERSDGFVYKTKREIEIETNIARGAQDRIRQDLEAKGYLATKLFCLNRLNRTVLHYKVLEDRLQIDLNAYESSKDQILNESSKRAYVQIISAHKTSKSVQIMNESSFRADQNLNESSFRADQNLNERSKRASAVAHFELRRKLKTSVPISIQRLLQENTTDMCGSGNLVGSHFDTGAATHNFNFSGEGEEEGGGEGDDRPFAMTVDWKPNPQTLQRMMNNVGLPLSAYSEQDHLPRVTGYWSCTDKQLNAGHWVCKLIEQIRRYPVTVDREALEASRAYTQQLLELTERENTVKNLENLGLVDDQNYLHAVLQLNSARANVVSSHAKAS